MRPLASPNMRRPTLSTALCACAALTLVPAMLAAGGCGVSAGAPGPQMAAGERSSGSSVTDSPAREPAKPTESTGFMSVGAITPVVAPAPTATQQSDPGPAAGATEKDRTLTKSGGTRGGKKPAFSTASSVAGDPTQGVELPQAAAAASASPSAPPPGGVKGATVDSTSGLSETEIRTAIVANQGSFRACYDVGAASAASAFKGTVALRATISAAGTVAMVDVMASTTQNPQVDRCVMSAVQRILFPSRGGGAVVAFPITFGQ
jgi:hypothetical protein